MSSSAIDAAHGFLLCDHVPTVKQSQNDDYVFDSNDIALEEKARRYYVSWSSEATNGPRVGLSGTTKNPSAIRRYRARATQS